MISNFYGNVEVLCNEFGFGHLMDVILDSAVAGLKKPDPKLFALAADRLKTAPEQILFVGDSYERDMIPAKSIGMKTAWLIGDTRRVAPEGAGLDVILRSLEELPDYLKPSVLKSSVT